VVHSLKGKRVGCIRRRFSTRICVRSNGKAPGGGQRRSGSGQLKVPQPLLVVSSRPASPWAATMTEPVTKRVEPSARRLSAKRLPPAATAATRVGTGPFSSVVGASEGFRSESHESLAPVLSDSRSN
jgi:hypothetical protein